MTLQTLHDMPARARARYAAGGQYFLPSTSKRHPLSLYHLNSASGSSVCLYLQRPPVSRLFLSFSPLSSENWRPLLQLYPWLHLPRSRPFCSETFPTFSLSYWGAQRANYGIGELPQRLKRRKKVFTPKWIRHRAFSAWVIQTGPFAACWVKRMWSCEQSTHI